MGCVGEGVCLKVHLVSTVWFLFTSMCFILMLSDSHTAAAAGYETYAEHWLCIAFPYYLCIYVCVNKVNKVHKILIASTWILKITEKCPSLILTILIFVEFNATKNQRCKLKNLWKTFINPINFSVTYRMVTSVDSVKGHETVHHNF